MPPVAQPLHVEQLLPVKLPPQEVQPDELQAVHRGEKFVQGEWRSHTEIWREGLPLWIDRQWLPGREEVFHSPHGLAGQPIVGSLVWVGNPISGETLAKMRNLWVGTGEIGMTQLQNGFLCRYRGSSTSEVRNWFTVIWQLLRVSVLNRSSCVPRVWQV